MFLRYRRQANPKANSCDGQPGITISIPETLSLSIKITASTYIIDAKICGWGTAAS